LLLLPGGGYSDDAHGHGPPMLLPGAAGSRPMALERTFPQAVKVQVRGQVRVGPNPRRRPPDYP